jgi:glycolate dehydrogenase FAD-binding subunit
MSPDTTMDASDILVAQVQQAFADNRPLRIVGGSSKLQLGRAVDAAPLDVGVHRGIVEYQPTELVITARAGTPLAEIEAALAEQGQMLAFEPPHLGANATLGGSLACGLSGPRRPFAGAARDFMLGVKMLNGRGEVLRFGGQVMKNVAGYDISRLMVGAQGTLGVLLEVSLKVLPRPVCEHTLVFDMHEKLAIEVIARLSNAALPLSAICHLPAAAQQPAQLYVRLSGAQAAVLAAGDDVRRSLTKASSQKMDADAAQDFWQNLRERRLPFFDEADALWRLSVPPATPTFAETLLGDCLLDWAGAQRWLKTDTPREEVQSAAQKMGGHATLLQRDATVHAPLALPLAALQARIKQAFDPKGILNPGRLYAGS